MKIYKRIFILLIGVVLFGLTNVNAYELQINEGKANKDVNVYTIPITLLLDQAEEATDITIPGVSCDTDYTDVSCEIVSSAYNSKDKIVTILKATGNQDAFNIKVINNSTSAQSGVTITLKYNNKTTSTQKKYTLDPKVEEKKKSSNNKLKAVYITNAKPTMTPAFNQDVLDYTIYNVSDTLRSLAFDWDCAEGSCSVDIEGPISVDGTKVELNVGENLVKLKVTAEDGSGPKIYNFKVYKGETTFNSSKLKSIVLGDYELSPKFDKNTKEYTAQVPYSLVTLATTLSYEAEDDNAIVEVKGHDNLVVGENEITIKVTSADKNDETTYKIVVTRLDDQNIIVKSYKDGKIGFIDSSNEKKELTEEEFEKQYPDEYKKIKDGTYKFDDDGNIVKDEDKTSDDTTSGEKKKSKTWLIVLLIVLGIVIIGVSGYFIFKKPGDKKKNKKGGKDDKNNKPEDEKEEKVEEVKEEEKSEEDLLNMSDEEAEEVNIRKNPETDLDYDIEKEIESVEHTASARSLDDTIDIDEALSDLMSTRQYNFKDDDSEE